MLYVRHASASGRLDELWEYNRLEQRLEVLVRLGAAVHELEVPICSMARPRFGAHPIVRVDSESWRVLPVRFVRAWPAGVEHLVAMNCPVGDLLAPGEQLTLTNATPYVDAELEKL